MRTMWAAGIAAVAALIGGGASAAPLVEIRDAAARVVVIPENRQDVKVEFVTVNPALPLTVRYEVGRVVVDGGFRHGVGGLWSWGAGCRNEFGRPTVRVRGLGKVSYDDLPQIVVRTPMDARLAVSGAVYGSVGRTDSLEVSTAGCGDWTVANVSGQLKLSTAGMGDVRAGSVGELVVHAAGAGDVIVKEIKGGARLDIAGASDIIVTSLSGPLQASIAGAGDVKIAGGHATEVVARIAGVGNIQFGGVADSVDASLAGMGDVEVAKVTGPVRKSIAGFG